MRRDHANCDWDWSHNERRYARFQFVALLSLIAALLALAGWSLYSALA